MLVDIGLKFYAVPSHPSDLEVKVMGQFNRFSGKAQVRRATLPCDSSYCYLNLQQKAFQSDKKHCSRQQRHSSAHIMLSNQSFADQTAGFE